MSALVIFLLHFLGLFLWRCGNREGWVCVWRTHCLWVLFTNKRKMNSYACKPLASPCWLLRWLWEAGEQVAKAVVGVSPLP